MLPVSDVCCQISDIRTTEIVGFFFFFFVRLCFLLSQQEQQITHFPHMQRLPMIHPHPFHSHWSTFTAFIITSHQQVFPLNHSVNLMTCGLNYTNFRTMIYRQNSKGCSKMFSALTMDYLLSQRNVESDLKHY